MTRSITQPLVAMASVANEVANGNMEANFPYLNTNDELGSVAKASNKMLDSIRENIERTKEHLVLENQMKERALIMHGDLKEAQLRVLQAQINPHFLFNTLNAGVQLSMMEGAEKTGLFLENVADFFRYNVKKIGEDTTIQDEINMIDTYIYILNVRYLGEIDFRKEVDETLLNVKMPSMVLQPIVENAIVHGVQGVDREGVIQLSVFAQDEKVVISIKDNGKGITKEMAKKIMTGEEFVKSGEGTGLGLDNVTSRLNSYFNQDDVFVIRSREDGQGTEVIVSFHNADG
jgi:sensor histidine kinase YesM